MLIARVKQEFDLRSDLARRPTFFWSGRHGLEGHPEDGHIPLTGGGATGSHRGIGNETRTAVHLITDHSVHTGQIRNHLV